MAIFETFSKRQKKLIGAYSDVFTYDSIPRQLRVQICHIWNQSLGVGQKDYMGENPVYKVLEERLAAEFGLFSLGNKLRGAREAFISFWSARSFVPVSLLV
jgi:hypothetical protein